MQFSLGSLCRHFHCVPSFQSKTDLSASLPAQSTQPQLSSFAHQILLTQIHTQIYICGQIGQEALLILTSVTSGVRRCRSTKHCEVFCSTNEQKWKTTTYALSFYVLYSLFPLPNPCLCFGNFYQVRGRIYPDLDLLCWNISLVSGSNRMQDKFYACPFSSTSGYVYTAQSISNGHWKLRCFMFAGEARKTHFHSDNEEGNWHGPQ